MKEQGTCYNVLPKITMVNRPKQTGKTTELLLKLHEGVKTYDYVVLLGHNINSHIELVDYGQSQGYSNIIYEVKTMKKITKLTLDHIRVLVLIDEPFSISPSAQTELLKFVNYANKHLNTHIDMFGIGTLEKNNAELLFEDFL